MNPGNPIHNYLKCFMEQQKFFFDKEAFQRREKLLVMPLKELPALVRRELVDELEDWLRSTTGTELEEAQRALFARHGEGMAPAPLPREAYRELAEACWSVIAGCC